jgi:hypothetical protein
MRFPENVIFVRDSREAMIYIRPSTRISFEFGGHLSFHNPPSTTTAATIYNFFETEIKL